MLQELGAQPKPIEVYNDIRGTIVSLEILGAAQQTLFPRWHSSGPVPRAQLCSQYWTTISVNEGCDESQDLMTFPIKKLPVINSEPTNHCDWIASEQVGEVTYIRHIYTSALVFWGMRTCRLNLLFFFFTCFSDHLTVFVSHSQIGEYYLIEVTI